MGTGLKKQVTEWITEQNYDAIVAEAAAGSEKCLRYVQMNVWGDSRDTLRWYAITALEQLAKAYSSKEEEVYRNVIRRAVWAMSDESGNVPWAAPEMMAVIIAANPKKYKEFVRIMISNGLDNPMCHEGVLWAVGYLGVEFSEEIGNYRDKMLKFLGHADANIRGMAVWAFRKLNYGPANELMVGLKEDAGTVWIYEDGKLTQRRIADLIADGMADFI